MLDPSTGVIKVAAEEANAGNSPLLPVTAQGLCLEVDRRRLIDGLDVTLAANTISVVMGPNGAGKSLLLRLLHGLLEPSAGSVRCGGKPMCVELRRRQAMVFQRPVLLRRSVAANLEFVLKLQGSRSRERRDLLLREVDLLHHARQPARLLSGGEQQRLALARALAAEPEVLFLDEPTASLDPASTLMIENAVVKAHRRGTKVVFVTHDLGQARRLADDVVFMSGGRLIEHAAADRFFRAPTTPAAQAYLEGRILI